MAPDTGDFFELSVVHPVYFVFAVIRPEILIGLWGHNSDLGSNGFQYRI